MRYEHYKPTHIPWLPEVPAHWEVRPYKSLYGFGKGLPITKENLMESGIPVISYGQIHAKENTGVKLSNHLLRYVSPDYLRSHPNCLLVEGDMAIADTSEDVEGCGNAVLMTYTEPVFAGYHTIIGRIKDKRQARYLAYVFLSDCWRAQVRSIVRGVKLFSITKTILSSTHFPLPPRGEQEAIVAFLDERCGKVERLVAAKERQVALLKEYKQRLIAEVVTRGLPGRQTSFKPSNIPWLPEVPAHWEVRRLKSLFTLRHEGYTEEEPLPVLSLLKDVGVILYEEKGQIGNKCKEDFSSYNIARKGDIVMNSMNVIIGSVGLSPYDGYISPAYYALIPAEGVIARYYDFLFHMAVVQQTMRSLAKGILEIRLRISTVNLFDMAFPLPPRGEQEAIVAFLDERCEQVDEAVRKLEAEVAALKAYKQRLIADVVTGQRKVV